jgi:hypothetical protein
MRSLQKRGQIYNNPDSKRSDFINHKLILFSDVILSKDEEGSSIDNKVSL